jgi:hypothetical protein
MHAARGRACRASWENITMNSTTTHTRTIAGAVLLVCALSLPALGSAATPAAKHEPIALGAWNGAALARERAPAAPATLFAATDSSGAQPLAWAEQKISAPDGAAGDNFSYAVSVSGTTAVVGASNAGVGNDGRGIAYVFTRSGGIWTAQQTLMADDGAADDGFGFSVSVSGDAVVIGAPYATVGGNGGEGAAYVFTRSGATWSQAQKLGPDDGTSNFNFGWSVALGGATAVITSPVAPVGENALQGKAYVFTDAGGSWSQTQTLLADDGSAFATFGSSVALDGTTVVVGAAGVDSYVGAAYVFDGSGGTWLQTGKLVADDGVATEFFGISVAVSGSTALVGAYNQRVDGHNGQGSAYLFTGSGGTWAQQQKLTASDGAAGARFGLSVALDGSTALVGSYFAAIGGNAQQGAAYVFTRTGGTWNETDKLFASDGAANDHFGNAAALAGDTALIGAFDATIDGQASQGAAYFYTRPTDLIFADGFDGATPRAGAR